MQQLTNHSLPLALEIFCLQKVSQLTLDIVCLYEGLYTQCMHVHITVSTCKLLYFPTTDCRPACLYNFMVALRALARMFAVCVCTHEQPCECVFMHLYMCVKAARPNPSQRSA